MAICPGIYHLTEARDGQLARVRLVGGRLTARQLAILAAAAEACGSGRIDLTHRANLQVRGLSEASAAELARRLVECSLATGRRARDRLRNIAAPPLAGIDPTEVLDVTPIARALDAAILDAPDLDALSPKFSFVIDGGGVHGIAGLAHDVGFRAERAATAEIAFRLSLGGHVTDWVIAADAIAATGSALAGWCGRLSPAGQRMAELVATRDVDAIVQGLADALPAGLQPTRRLRPDGAARAFDLLPVGQYDGITGGLANHALVIGIPPEQSTATTLHRLADMSSTRGDGDIRFTPWNSVVIAGLSAEGSATVASMAASAGLLTVPSSLRIIACAGARGCLRTQFDTQAAAQQLAADLSESAALDRAAPVTIHLSGCRRGCAHPAASDVLVVAGADGRLRIAPEAAPSTAPDDDVLPVTAVKQLSHDVLRHLAGR